MVSTSFRAASSDVLVSSSLLWARRAPGNARLEGGGGGEVEEGEEQEEEEEEEVKVTLLAALMFRAGGLPGPESREKSETTGTVELELNSRFQDERENKVIDSQIELSP